jgi:hypothetical protein
VSQIGPEHGPSHPSIDIRYLGIQFSSRQGEHLLRYKL